MPRTFAQREKTVMSDLLVKERACAHRPGMPLSLPLSYLSSTQETHIHHTVFIIQELGLLSVLQFKLKTVLIHKMPHMYYSMCLLAHFYKFNIF